MKNLLGIIALLTLANFNIVKAETNVNNKDYSLRVYYSNMYTQTQYLNVSYFRFKLWWDGNDKDCLFAANAKKFSCTYDSDPKSNVIGYLSGTTLVEMLSANSDKSAELTAALQIIRENNLAKIAIGYSSAKLENLRSPNFKGQSVYVYIDAQ